MMAVEIPKNRNQWIVFIIKYASSIVLLIGAFFQYYDMASDLLQGLTKHQRIEKESQFLLWEKNKECYRTAQPYIFQSDKKENIRIVLCKSADIYVEIGFPDPNIPPISRWIEIKRSTKSSFNLQIFDNLNAQSIRNIPVENLASSIEICRGVTDEYAWNIKKYSGNVCWETRVYFKLQNIERFEVKCQCP